MSTITHPAPQSAPTAPATAPACVLSYDEALRLPAAPARFASAWEAFQFASEWLGRARKHYFLAELVGDADRCAYIADEIAFAEKAVAATEREWRKADKVAVCETMRQPKESCRCPDCGPSLTDYAGD
mgnify:CR=1 FL=1